MRGLPVPGRVLLCAVNFYQHESLRLFQVLQDIKSGDTRLLHTSAGVWHTSLPESLHLIGFDLAKNMDNMHRYLLWLTIWLNSNLSIHEKEIG